MISNKANRSSNFELLRIFTMLLIIMGHMNWQAFDHSQVNLAGALFMKLFGQGARIGVNLFLMTGVWFMCDSEFSSKRILKLYGALWFYSVPITLLMVALGVSVSKTDLISAFFPYLRRRMWFVPLYITLLLISPFLKRAIYNMSEAIHRKLVILGFFLICFICSTTVFMDKYLDSLMWFIYVYFAVSYYKRYLFEKIRKKNVYLSAGIAIYLVLIVSSYACNNLTSAIFTYANKVITQYIVDYKSLPNALCSIFIFIYFSKLDIGSNKYINCISRNTLDVYMIHQSDTFYNFLWLNICRTHDWQGSDHFIILFIIVAILVYSGASIIGALRTRLIEPLWCRCRLFTFLSDKLDRFYGSI